MKYEKNYNPQQMKEIFGNKKTIGKIFSKLEIDNHVITKIHSTYTIDDDRCAIAVLTDNLVSRKREKILIDVNATAPTWKQMMDVTFGIGSDCDKIIVLFDSHVSIYGIISDVYMADSFSEINNRCGIENYLLDWNMKNGNFHFTPSDQYSKYGPQEKSEPISKEDFNKAEFRLYYDHYIDFEPLLVCTPEDWMDRDWIYFVEECEMEIYYKWDENGIYLNADAKTERGIEILKYAVENKLDELSQKFNPGNVEINKELNIPVNLIMKIDSRPFDDFVYASEDEKLNLAEYVYEKEQELLEYFMNLAEILEPLATAA